MKWDDQQIFRACQSVYICFWPSSLNHEDIIYSESQDVRHLWEIKDTVLAESQRNSLSGHSFISLLFSLLLNICVISSFFITKHLHRMLCNIIKPYFYILKSNKFFQYVRLGIFLSFWCSNCIFYWISNCCDQRKKRWVKAEDFCLN